MTPDPPEADPRSERGETPTSTWASTPVDEQNTAEWSGAVDDEPPPGEEGVPARFGRYRILRIIGEGGMGTVYEARQDQPKRTVALKVIRSAGLPPIRLKRFELESQLLARLQHPGIAQVYDAGTVLDEHGRSLPYFAMELIRGASLRRYADDHKLGTRARLDLIARVCDAVGHAHQRGVIHRDLKPANILVDETGQPRVLDFGVARATDADDRPTTLQTDMGQLLGTLPYMSPEQAGGDPDAIDTRSDIYSLGVVAYELLAGRLPYKVDRAAVPEAVRVIQQDEPTPLSTIDRSLRGDVETIVLKALEKDRARRYDSAEAFAADIRRYLNHEPIAARRASARYRAWKFAQRHKIVVGAIVAVVLALSVGLVIALREAAVARQERDRAATVAAFMDEMLQGVGPDVALGRDTALLRSMMDAAAARIEKGELKDAPAAELTLRGTIGDVYRQLALYPEATRMLKPAPEIARVLSPGDSVAAASALDDLGTLAMDEDRFEDAERDLRAALEMRKRLAPQGDLDVADSLGSVANVLANRGKDKEAEPLSREALALYRRLTKGDSVSLAVAINDLAQVVEVVGSSGEAEALYRESLAMQKRLHPGDHPETATTLNNLAVLVKNKGNLAEAETIFRETLAMNRRLRPGDHPFVAGGINNLASTLEAMDRRPEAEALYLESLQMRRRLFKGDHTMVAGGLNNYALVLQRQKKFAQAEPLFRESIAMRQRLFKGDHPSLALDLNNLALLLRDTGRLEPAEKLGAEAIAMFVRTSGPDAWLTGYARQGRGRALMMLKRFKEAEAELVEAERVMAGPKTPAGRHATSLATLAEFYETWARADPRGGHEARAAEWKAKAETAEAAKTPRG